MALEIDINRLSNFNIKIPYGFALVIVRQKRVYCYLDPFSIYEELEGYESLFKTLTVDD